MSVITVTKENFDTVVLKSEKPMLLDFYADWCGPCKRIAAVVEQIAEEYPQYAVGKINVDEQKELASQFGVMSIPSLFVIKDGKIVSSVVGAIPKTEIIKMFG
ncbi:MAG: thioredoxin [Anaerofustis stercorihominis]|nr:thioredoxin [Anaerofustis stercorihominis]